MTKTTTTTYTHLLNGLEASATPWGGLGSFAHEHLPNGARRKTTFPNSVTAEHTYDAGERLRSRVVRASSSATSTLSSWQEITYDDSDNRVAETVTQRQTDGSLVPVKSGSATYSYDALERLTSAKHPFDQKPSTYELDDAGSIIRETGASSRADYYYHAPNRLGSKFFSGSETTTEDGATTTVESSGRSVYSYDRLGDLTRRQLDMKSVVAMEQGQAATIVDMPTMSNITTTTYDAASTPGGLPSPTAPTPTTPTTPWGAWSEEASRRLPAPPR